MDRVEITGMSSLDGKFDKDLDTMHTLENTRMKILREVKAIAKTTTILILVAVVLVAAVGGGIYYSTIPPTPTVTTPTVTTPAKPPKPTGPLMVYSALHEFEIGRICSAFAEETGIEAKFLRASAGELTARVEAESKKPIGDVVLGGPCLNHEIMKGKGLLLQYKSPTAVEIDPQFHDKDNYWYGFYLGAIGFCVNTARLKTLRFAEPKSWKDLLNQTYKGEIVTSNPATSGTAQTIFCTILQLRGWDAGWEYLKAFHKNVHHYETSGAAPAQRVGAGEFAIGLAFGHDIQKIILGGYPVKLIYPEEGTGTEIGGLSIIKDGPNPAAAKAFVDWMLGKKAGQLHTDISLRVSTRKDVTLPLGATPLEKIKLMNYDYKWAADNMSRILKEWEKVVAG